MPIVSCDTDSAGLEDLGQTDCTSDFPDRIAIRLQRSRWHSSSSRNRGSQILSTRSTKIFKTAVLCLGWWLDSLCRYLSVCAGFMYTWCPRLSSALLRTKMSVKPTVRPYLSLRWTGCAGEHCSVAPENVRVLPPRAPDNESVVTRVLSHLSLIHILPSPYFHFLKEHGSKN